ncbi:glutamate--tRNA ligase family protein, partial [Bacillus thuringiensis]|uniref:glutamate--tRNA ligase family protein n=1 Tax=Bacillus thuringiensis TaxID=1428 RepID=UPI0021B177AE
KHAIPTYNFPLPLDHHLIQITHLLPPHHHISNTPKQMIIYEPFAWDIPQFPHMTLILNETPKNLSNRHQCIIQFIQQYKHLPY